MTLKALCALAIPTCIAAAAFACMDEPGAGLQPVAETAQESAPAILLAAGDIAGCGEGYNDEATAAMVEKLPGTIALLGDVVYRDGLRWQFRNCYHPSWGKLLSRSRPSPGNHEYNTDEAAPYYEYFGSLAGPAGEGYYTYKLGTWRIYSLNSERNIAKQANWLKSHLAANPAKCVLAYWHKPLYTSGQVPPSPEVRPLFNALYQAGADVVLNGHQHHYERFTPQDANGKYNARGVREFVVGTGGTRLVEFGTPVANSQVRWVEGWGVLRLTLSPGKYGWKFVALPPAESPDTGSARCS